MIVDRSMQAVNHQRGLWVFIGGAVILLALALASCSKESQASRETTSKPGTAVLVAVVQSQSVPVDIVAYGNIESGATVSVRSQVTGVLKEVQFRQGDLVKANQPIALIDDRGYQASLEQAQANLQRDIAQRDYAFKELAHYEEMKAKGVAAQDELDQSQSRSDALIATVKADDAAIRMAKLQVEYCTITSPQDGVAGSLMVDEGNIVKVNDTAIVTVMQIEPINISFSVPQQFLPQIRRQQTASPLTVSATIPGDEGQPLAGKLTFIDNNIDVTTGMIRLKATCPNESHRLWPGQFVNVVMRLSTQDRATVVPVAAIGTGQDGQYVFVVQDDMTVRSKAIKVDREVGELAVIGSGLEVGQRVVIDGQYRLADGGKIAIKKDLSGKPASAPSSKPATAPASRPAN